LTTEKETETGSGRETASVKESGTATANVSVSVSEIETASGKGTEIAIVIGSVNGNVSVSVTGIESQQTEALERPATQAKVPLPFLQPLPHLPPMEPTTVHTSPQEQELGLEWEQEQDRLPITTRATQEEREVHPLNPRRNSSCSSSSSKL